MVSLANSQTSATSKRWHLWEIDLRFAFNSTPGRVCRVDEAMHEREKSEGRSPWGEEFRFRVWGSGLSVEG